MKLLVNTELLNSAAKNLSRVIYNNNPLPILSDFLCEVSDNVMKMTASNGDAMMSVVVPLKEMEGDGRFCVPASQMVAAINSIPFQEATIIADTENGDSATFRIQHTAGETYFSIDNADEFPTWEDETRTEDLVIKSDVMINAVKRTAWSVAKDDLRPLMTCIYFKLIDESLDIVASNGHSLVKVCTTGEGDYGLRCGGFLMPGCVAKLIETLDGIVNVKWNNKTVLMNDGVTTIAFRQVEGKYVNYNSVIPDNCTREVQVQKSIMLNAIKSTLPFANNSSEMLVLTLSKGKITLRGEDTDFMRGAFVDIAVDYNGEDLKIGLKGPALIKMLKNIPSEYVILSMTDSEHPMLVEPEEQPDDSDILMLLMPMLIND